MAFAISINIEASGRIEIRATDHAGGCSYNIGTADPTNYINPAEAIKWSRYIPAEWEPLKPYLTSAVWNVLQCLPPADCFDEWGIPVKKRA